MPSPGGLQQGKSVTISEELRLGRSQEVAMKAKVDVPNNELKVWCAQCCIRIARNEERTVLDGKTYHTRCYSKLHPTSSKLKA
jgi:hypothetical protein